MSIPQEIKEIVNQYLYNISESISFVFSNLLKTEIRQKKIYNRRLQSLPNDIIITIEYKTDLKGSFSFFFSLDTARFICKLLVPGIDTSFIEDEHLDILGELGNMISGNTLTKLQLIHNDIYLQPPSLMAFHTLLAAEKKCWNFSSNFELDQGKMGILFTIEK